MISEFSNVVDKTYVGFPTGPWLTEGLKDVYKIYLGIVRTVARPAEYPVVTTK